MTPGAQLIALLSCAATLGVWTTSRLELKKLKEELASLRLDPASPSASKSADPRRAPGADLPLKSQVQELTRQNQDLLRQLEQAIAAAKPPPQPAELAKKLEEIRGLTFSQPPVWIPVTGDELVRKVEADVRNRYLESAAALRAKAWRAMGWVTGDFDFAAAVASLATLSPGGFYEPGTGQFFYPHEQSLAQASARSSFMGALLPVLIGQNYPHATASQGLSENDDEARALATLVRGDTVFHRTRYSIADSLQSGGEDGSMTPAPYSSPATAPPFFQIEHQFTDSRGPLFVETIMSNGGVSALRQTYARPPRSTAELLHPELYQQGTPPETITVADPQVLGALPYFTNVAGEFGAWYLFQSLPPQDLAETAAAGWRADRYWVYEGGTPGDHVVWRSRWATTADARECFDALRRVLMERYSIPWQAEYDAVPQQFRVTDPQRAIRLRVSDRTVQLIDSVSAPFAEAAEKKFTTDP